LCHAALDASVSDIKKLCEGYRWNDDNDSGAENTKAMQQWLSRSLTWTEASDGNTKIQITLPPELAQAFLNSVEQSVNQTDTTSTRISQRRADAAVLMAEKSLQSEGREIATSDRFHLIHQNRHAKQSPKNAQPYKTPALLRKKPHAGLPVIAEFQKTKRSRVSL